MILPSFLSWGSIDGIDMLSGLGVGVENGSDSFRAIPQPKPGYSYDWGGEDGTEFDLLSPVFSQAGVLTLDIWVLADTLEDLDARLITLETLLKQPGYRDIYCKKWNKTKQYKLKSFPKNIESPGYARDLFGVQMSLEFDEVVLKSSVNLPPIVFTGGSNSITLPTNSLQNTGASATGRNGATITSTIWSFVSGPSTPAISNANLLNPLFSGLNTQGNYIFKLTAVDSNNLSSNSNKTITVLPENVTPEGGLPYNLPFNL